MNSAKLIVSLLSILWLGVASAQSPIKEYGDPVKLPETINSSSAEESLPLLSKDGKVMYFVRSFHPDNVGGPTGGHDIWYSTKNEDGTWSAASNDLEALNNETNNAVAGVSQDGSTVYLVNTYKGKKQSGVGISKATKTENGWSQPVDLKVPGINPISETYSFYITPEEDILLISMHDDFSFGKNDIYLSSKDAQGSWNVPTNLGERINTSGNEISPYLSPDRKRLYFSTDGRGGMGGQDVFVSQRNGESWTEWSMPINLPSGINSEDFDAYFSVYEDGTVLFSSSRNDTLANIYTSHEKVPGTDEDDDENEDMVQRITEADPMVDENIEVVGAHTEGIDPKSQIEKGQAMDNILYDFDKYSLRQASKDALDVLIKELKKDATLKVRLVGHCDSLGTDAYNLPLSRNRANAAKDYLVKNGIASNRIDTKGEGKRQPAASNATPEGRQLNRRVEIYFE